MATQERQPPPRPPPPSVSQSHHVSNQPLPDQVKSFEDFRSLHEAAFAHVNTGLAADEKGDDGQAEISYKKGYELMERCLRCDLEDGTSLARAMGIQNLEKAREMQSKLNKTRQQIVYRMRDLETRNSQASALPRSNESMGELQSPMGACALPSYDEAMSESGSSLQPPSYDEDELTALGESLMRAETGMTAPPESATELMSIQEGVQIFFISPNGLVSAPSYPASLHVVMFDQESDGVNHAGAPPAFLYVGDWVYPLIPGTSPSLQTSYGAYIFPDVTNPQPGSAVGLMLPDEGPEVRQTFEDLISAFTVMGSEAARQQQQPQLDTDRKLPEEQVQEGTRQAEAETNDTASKISKGILVAADWITWGVNKGAEKAGELMKAGSERFRRESKPAEQPTKIDPKVQQGLLYARKATHGAVKVTGFVVNKLGQATVALAKQLAPHVKRHGEKYVPKSLKKEDGSGKSKLDGVVKVAASGVQGFSTVFMGLERAAKCLGKSLTQETVQVVTHKYGGEAGALTENTMYTAGNVALAAYNVDNIGVKAVAKRAAKETGKAVLNDLNTKNQNGKNAGMPPKDPDNGGDFTKN